MSKNYNIFFLLNKFEDAWCISVNGAHHEVEFEVQAKRRRRVTVDPDVYTRLEDQARVHGLLPETLVNLWLAERLAAEKAA